MVSTASTNLHEPSHEDLLDYEWAERGLIDSLSPCTINNASGATIWDNEAWNFLQSECPSTVNAKLWRQSQLNHKQGLFEVVPGIYQLRGFDLSVMTVVEGSTGAIVIDPLISCETARAGWELYKKHRGERPVTGMIYSHSHGDHYMGAGGVLPELEDGKTDYDFPIVAPEGFIEAVMSESIIAGPAMRQRAAFMYGRALPRNATGHVGVGLGMGSSTGTTSLIRPNILIQKTGEKHTIDGVDIIFQMVPDTEAPAEINFYFPSFQALCIPECATNCMHNIVTLRGAQVRDSKAWSRYLDEALVQFGQHAIVMFQSHNWPCWGRQHIISRLSEQRDMYAFLHDQTVRMMNLGLTGIEIAEQLVLPPGLRQKWHTQGYYGSISHNVKGVYQKYMTWFDGNPAHLWKLPPADEGRRYVDCLGGVGALCDKAERYSREGDLRFAATLLGHAIAANPEDARVKPLLASVYEQLGFGCENATWRNFYLTAAQELRTGIKAGMIAGGRTALGPNLTVDQWFDVLAVQLNGELAGQAKLIIDVMVKDVGVGYRLMVSNGTLIYRRQGNQDGVGHVEGPPNLSLTLTKAELLHGLRGNDLHCEKMEGDTNALKDLLALTAVSKGSARGPSQL
jgi:alkyl sulfatase BDS1-like metallo-beta-lactamase superfamily hydrolase